mgnify:CR=1 FL=1
MSDQHRAAVQGIQQARYQEAQRMQQHVQQISDVCSTCYTIISLADNCVLIAQICLVINWCCCLVLEYDNDMVLKAYHHGFSLLSDHYKGISAC